MVVNKVLAIKRNPMLGLTAVSPRQ